MIDLSSSCIFSGSTEDLNTTMVVTVDGDKYKVAISEKHEDDAIPSKVKELVSKKANEREAKLQKLQDLADELGIPINALQTTAGGLLMVQNPPPEQTQQIIETNPRHEPRQQIDPSKMKRVGGFRVQKNQRTGPTNDGLTAEEAQQALEQAARSSSGQYESPTAREAPRFVAHKLPNKVGIRDHNGNVIEGSPPQNVSQKRQVVKGRAGIPISLPKSITARSANGTLVETTINVVNTGGDQALQRRFKDHRYQAQCDYANECRPCRGTGMVGRRKEECRHCGGTGLIA